MDTLAPLPPEAQAQIDQAASMNLPDVVVINHPAESPVARAMFAHHGFQDRLDDSSLLLMFLVSDGKALGELVVIAEGADQYSDTHARITRT